MHNYYAVLTDHCGIIVNSYLQARVCAKLMKNYTNTRMFSDFSKALTFLLDHFTEPNSQEESDSEMIPFMQSNYHSEIAQGR